MLGDRFWWVKPDLWGNIWQTTLHPFLLLIILCYAFGSSERGQQFSSIMMHQCWLAHWFLVKFLVILNFRCCEVTLTSILAWHSLLLMLLEVTTLLKGLQLVCEISLSIFSELNLARIAKIIAYNGTRLTLLLGGMYIILFKVLRQGHRLGSQSRVLDYSIHLSFRLPEVIANLKFLFVSTAFSLTFLWIQHGGQWKFLIMSLVHLLQCVLILLLAFSCTSILQLMTGHLLLLGNLRNRV